MPDLNNLANMITTQKTWSWTVLGLFLLVLFLIVRSFFFRPILKRAKQLNSKWYREIQKAYLKRSFGGWFLFFVSLLALIYAWLSGNYRNWTVYESGLLALILVPFFLAIMAHLVALGIALVYVLKQLENNQISL